MAVSNDAKIGEYRRLVARSYDLAEEQKRCMNIIFSPGGYTQFEAFEAIARWDKVRHERALVIHRMAELYVLCPYLHQTFREIFFEAKKKSESHRDW